MTSKHFIIILILLLIISCNEKQIAFDKIGWNQKEDMFYKNRETMLSDLLKNHLKLKMKYSDVLKLLGESENYEPKKENEIIYEVETEYGTDIDPTKGTNLVLQFSKDSILTNIKIDHWD